MVACEMNFDSFKNNGLNVPKESSVIVQLSQLSVTGIAFKHHHPQRYYAIP